MDYKENQYFYPGDQNCVIDHRKVLELYLHHKTSCIYLLYIGQAELYIICGRHWQLQIFLLISQILAPRKLITHSIYVISVK